MIPYNIEWLGEASSTNDLAREARYGHGAVVVADSQTRGRGQQGNGWHSEPGSNLTFSVVLALDFLPAGEQFSLLQAVSLAVCDAIDDLGMQARIKWPNDIYIADRKVAGLLIENDIMGTVVSRTIAGIGLNVNQAHFPEDLPNPTSLRVEARGAAFDRSQALGKILDALDVRYAALTQGRSGELHRDYLSRLYRLGERYLYRLPGQSVPFEGIIRSVAPSGELHVEHPAQGIIRSYLFKEIEFMI